ncbi:MAG: heme-binding protein [Mycobacterium sp.]|jgi:hemophore|nr:heme-binding protein [Mycobacterium sp.]
MTGALKTVASARRALCAAFAVTAAGGVAVAALAAGSPSATAAQDPCAASEVAKTVGSVATSMGSYLDSHPQTNTALTTISQQQGGPQSLVVLKTYFDANPQASKDMEQLQQPLVNLSTKCRLPLTLPQLMGLMQNAQGALPGGTLPGTTPGTTLPGSLPGALQTAQTVGTPGAASPVQPSPASAVTQGPGPLPGPSAITTR